MDCLETRLRSWKPRRPRPGLERRLFGRAAGCSATARWRSAWLAPAAAGALLALVLVNPPAVPTGSSVTASNAWAELVMSNQSYAAYLPGSFQRAHNQLESFAGMRTLAALTNAAP